MYKILSGYDLTDEQFRKFELLTDFMLEYNEKVNLTRITDREEIYVKHYLDSLLMLKSCNVPRGTSVIDVGSGAGIPGLPLCIVRPDLRVTMLDSTKKKCGYITAAAAFIGVKCGVIWGRAEEVTEKYGIAVARAVAPLPKLYKWLQPLAPVCIAMKGGGEVFAKEYGEAKPIFKGKNVTVKTFTLPGEQERNIVVIE